MDLVFADIMDLEDKLSGWKQEAIYQGVNWFGKNAWESNRKNKV
jgi:hypothetical protein